MKSRSCLTFVLLFFAAGLAIAQPISWVRLNYPPSSAIADILILSNGSLLCATSNSGVFLSTDKGQNWQAVNEGLAYLGIQDLFQSDSGLILAASAAGIFRLDTAQLEWNALPTPQNNYMKVFALGNNRILAAVWPGTLLSEDGGVTWSPTLTVTTEPPVFTDYLVVGDSIIFAGTRYGVYRSDDLGKTWVPTGLQGMTINDVELDSRGRVYALVFYRGVGTYYSDDLGVTWIQHRDGIGHVLPWSMHISSDDRIFIGSVDGILSVRSSSEGSYIDVLPDGHFSSITCIETSGARDLYVGTELGGIYTLRNDMETFRCINQGLPLGEGRVLGVDDSYIYAANPYAGIYRSPDVGLNWYPADTELGGSHLYTFDSGAEDLLLGTTIEIAWVGNLWRSTDHGMTWNSFQEGIPLVDPGKWPWINVVLDIDRNSMGDGFALIDGDGIYQQISGTSVWHMISENFPDVRALSFCIGPDDRVYVGADDGAVYCSSNGGVSWDISIAAKKEHWFHYLHTGPSGIIAMRSQYGIANGTESFLLPPGSSTWKDLQTHSLNLHINVMVVDESGALYGATDSTGIIRSNDGGQSWVFVNEGLGALGVHSLSIHPTGFLLCGTSDDGLYRAEIPSTTSVESREAPVHTDLLGCFPNPFNSSVEIRFSVMIPGEARLEVFDLLGRSVALLFSAALPVGHHTVTWNAEHHTSGVYFLRFSSGGALAAKRLLLAK